MKKLLIIDKCNNCTFFENSMTYDCCCNNPKVTMKERGIVRPRKIQEHFGHGIQIPNWCPLENSGV